MECVPVIDDDIIIFEVMSPAEEEQVKKKKQIFGRCSLIMDLGIILLRLN